MKKQEYINFIRGMSTKVDACLAWHKECLGAFVDGELARADLFDDNEVIEYIDTLKDNFDYFQEVWKYENQAHFRNMEIDHV